MADFIQGTGLLNNNHNGAVFNMVDETAYFNIIRGTWLSNRNTIIIPARICHKNAMPIANAGLHQDNMDSNSLDLFATQ
jgi:hypothetical protein